MEYKIKKEKPKKSPRYLNSIKFGVRHNDLSIPYSAYHLILWWCKTELSKFVNLALENEESFRLNMPKCVIGISSQKALLEYLDLHGFEETKKHFLHRGGNRKRTGWKKGDDTDKVIDWVTGFRGSDSLVAWGITSCPDYIKDKLPSEYIFDYSKRKAMFYREIVMIVMDQWNAYITKQHDLCLMSEKITKGFIDKNDKYLSSHLEILNKKYRSNNIKINKLVNNIQRRTGVVVDVKDKDSLIQYVTDVHRSSKTKIEVANNMFLTSYPPVEYPEGTKDKDKQKPVYDYQINKSTTGFYNKIMNEEFTEDVLIEFGKPFKKGVFDIYFNLERSKNTNMSGSLKRLIRKHCNHNNSGVNYAYMMVWSYNEKHGYSIHGITLPFLYERCELENNKDSVFIRINNQNSFKNKYNLDHTFECFDHLHKNNAIDRSKAFMLKKNQIDKLKTWDMYEETKFCNPSQVTMTFSKKNNRPLFIICDTDRRTPSTKNPTTKYPYDMISLDMGVNKTATGYLIKLNEDGSVPPFDPKSSIFINFDDKLVEELMLLEEKQKKMQRKRSKNRRKRSKTNRGFDAAYTKICQSITNKREEFIRASIKKLLHLAPVIVIGEWNSGKLRASTKGNDVQDGVNVSVKATLNRKSAESKSSFFTSYIKLQFDKYSTINNILGLIFINESYTSITCPYCNTQDKTQRNGEVYSCNCCNKGEIDADVNGAYNIGRKYITQEYTRMEERKTARLKKDREKPTRLQRTLPQLDYSSVNLFPLNWKKDVAKSEQGCYYINSQGHLR